MKNLLLVVCVFFTHTTLAQKLTGKVVDEDNQPLPYVSINIEQQPTVLTNLDGEYSIDIPHTNSKVIYSFMGYETHTITHSGGVYDLKMVPSSLKIDDVNIIVKKNNSSESVLVIERKELVGVESSVGSMELSKKGISNAQDGLKKVTSVTFGNNSINVRGLDDRYNQVTLNDIPLPSNNADRKNLDLRILPVFMMDNIKVRKSYSTDQWSNVAGAQINILTSDIKEIKSLSVSTNYNTLTPTIGNNITLQYGTKINKNLGVYNGVNLIRGYQHLSGVTRLVNKQGNYVLDYNYRDEVRQLIPSGMSVISYDKDGFSLRNTILVINQNKNTYRETDGEHFDYEKNIFTIRNTPENHLLVLDQLQTKIFRDNYIFNGIVSYGRVQSGENGREQYVFLYDNEYKFNNIDKLDNHVFWNQNVENRYNTSLTFDLLNGKLKKQFGYVFSYNTNNFDYQQKYYDLGGVNNQFNNIDPNNVLYYINQESTNVMWVNNPASNVHGTIIINGLFYKSGYDNNNHHYNWGIRLENPIQTVKFRDQLSPIFERTIRLNNLDVLPYFGYKNEINNQLQFKLSSSITTIRPRFREMTPFIYTEVFAGSKIQGNPNIINSKVFNNDLSIEYYPNRGEVIGIGVFHKEIKNPIERINVATASGRLETFQNSDRASVFGIEFDTKKKINKFTFDLNLSYLVSTIHLVDSSSSSVVTTNFDRPLQGSTPLLFNSDIFYQINKKTSIGLVYNYSGKKITAVGVYGLGDVYSQSQNFLNLILNTSHNKFNFSFRANNLLNTKFENIQNTDIGNLTVSNYLLGRTFTLNLSYKM